MARFFFIPLLCVATASASCTVSPKVQTAPVKTLKRLAKDAPIATEKQPALSAANAPHFYLLTVIITLDRISAQLLRAGIAKAAECRKLAKTPMEYNVCIKKHWVAFQAWRRMAYPQLGKIVVQLYDAVLNDKPGWQKQLTAFVCAMKRTILPWKPYMGGKYDAVMAPLMKLPAKCKNPKTAPSNHKPSSLLWLDKDAACSSWSREFPETGSDFGI